mgnify:CR=1 FL=1
MDIIEAIKQKYYKEGKSQQQIADELGISQWMVSDRMRKARLKTKPKTWKLGQRKYELNEAAFDKITPHAAWVLGWLVSDGFVSKSSNSFGVKVSPKDVDALEKIKSFFSYSGPILKGRSRLKATGKTYGHRLLKITSPKLKQTLLSLGVSPSKTSHETYLPTVEGEALDRQFIKGVFEGDGSLLYYPKTNRFKFQVVGTSELLHEIQDRLVKYLGIGKTKIHCQNSVSNHHLMQYSGKHQVPKIARWIYQDSIWHLDRKHNTYKRMTEL